ncbi:hypothetical protein ACIBIZ_50860 [Nonomuraea spiralis]|uniref:hypothetical protein n=1 Tax=Nonomuraea spiralis TaxID=46182 RepID=UPI0037A3D5EB
MRQGRDNQSKGSDIHVDHHFDQRVGQSVGRRRGGGQVTGVAGGLLGRAALWPASVLTAAVTADLLRRRFTPARLRLAAAAYGLLERTGVRPARPRLTDRQRLERQLLTWRQAHPDTSWSPGRVGPAGTGGG